MGAPEWMGKGRTLAYTKIPHFLSTGGGPIHVACMVKPNSQATADLAIVAPGANVLQAWQDGLSDPEIDLGQENEALCAFLALENIAPGYNESNIIEAAKVILSITKGHTIWPTFEAGHHSCQTVDACRESSRIGARDSVG
ncbi:hypothetical protein MCELHM10_02850 [Paracoccaceae bacterium]